MLRDIVVDTNVLKHASDPRVSFCGEANSLITALEGCSTSLCVDKGTNIKPVLEGSKIGVEYLENLQIGMRGYHFVVQLAQTGRISFIPDRVDAPISRKINQTVRKPRDRTFLKVAINSQDHFFCSHDLKHFYDGDKHLEIKRSFNVSIRTASETVPFLVPEQ